MSGMRKLSDVEYESMYSYLKITNQHRNMALLSALRWTGYRIKEILSLRISDVVLPNGQIVDRIHVKPRNMKKRQSRPSVRVHPQLSQDLELFLQELKKENRFNPERYLFVSRKGENQPISYTQAYRIIKDAAEARDVYGAVACHSLRKTFAQAVYENTGKDIVKTQIVMGHASAVSTSNYIGVAQEDLDQAVLMQ